MTEVNETKNSTVRFTVVFEGWTPAFEVFPVENSDGLLVGGFLVIEGPIWKCFVSRSGYPESLFLNDSDNPPWITPVRETDDSIIKLIISNIKMNDESKRLHITDGNDNE
jgi:hypothetical protein